VPGMELPDGVRDHLLAAGASEDEIDRVMDDDALFTLAGDVVRRRDIEWMPIEDVAATAGVSVEDVERYRLLVGLPARDNLVPEWTIYGLESHRVAASLVGDEVARAFHRVLAASAATVAAAATAIALNDATPLLREMDLPPVDTLQLLDAMVIEMTTRTPRHGITCSASICFCRRVVDVPSMKPSCLASQLPSSTSPTRRGGRSRSPSPGTRPRCRGSRTRPGRRLRPEGPGW
jgi:hypothetical protein